MNQHEPGTPEVTVSWNLKENLRDVERKYFTEVYESLGRNQCATAAALGVTTRTVGRKVKRYGLETNKPGTGKRNAASIGEQT